MPTPGPAPHLLRQLVFPDRYEALVDVLGPDVANVVVPPDKETSQTFEKLAHGVRSKRRGTLVPISAETGTGKTTLVNSLSVFLPTDYRSSVPYAHDQVTFSNLRDLAEQAVASASANEQRILPIVVDDREGAPPSDAEIAAIKSFVRHAESAGNRAVVLWPETSDQIATEMSARYKTTAGAPAIQLPARVHGPNRDVWQQIAVHTLELANQTPELEQLGVNPRDYDPEKSHTLGDYLATIAEAFDNMRLDMLRAARKPIRLAIVFATASPDAGVLLQLTNSNRFGLVDAGALLSAAPDREVSRFWQKRRGLLTQLIVQLDVHAFSLPPAVTIPSLRRHGVEEMQQKLQDLGVTNRRADTLDTWRRSDLGKFLAGTAGSTFENRGTPATASGAAFASVAADGLTAGKDKQLNKAMLVALEAYLTEQQLDAEDLQAETQLLGSPLVPDNSFALNGDQYCIEYTWRASKFLESSRADAAVYILTKLRNYGRELQRLE